jgi:hypothetical protein
MNQDMKDKLEALISKTPSKWVEESNKRFDKKPKMNRKNIIVFIQGSRVEAYGNLKKCCEFEKLPYHTLARLKFPIVYNNITIHKTEFK